MTEIERKALALLNEVQIEMHGKHGWYEGCNRTNATPVEAVCRAIEQHEAFKQEVSDAVEATLVHMLRIHGATTDRLLRKCLGHFILPKPVDPLVEAVEDWINNREFGEGAASLRAAIEKRGGKIVWGEGA